jgi:biopolymer transport protein ExbD
MFFLLLFFLIISTLANPNVIKMTLPKAQSNEKNKQAIHFIRYRGQKFYIDKQPVCLRTRDYTNVKMDSAKTKQLL